MDVTRRDFVETAFAMAASALAAAPQAARAAEPAPPQAGPNDRLRVAVIGANGRGGEHIGQWAGMSDAELAAGTVATDMFTPRTITRFTGHQRGAVYGSGMKHRRGLTAAPNVYLCGTDQGFLGIVGAMLSGISMANHHILQRG
jgi:hypothetical protein